MFRARSERDWREPGVQNKDSHSAEMSKIEMCRLHFYFYFENVLLIICIGSMMQECPQ